jgi:chloride channel protein, CIC family
VCVSLHSPEADGKWHRYFAKWITIAVLIGIVCGLSALALFEAIRIISQLTLGDIAGYSPPFAGGEGGPTNLVIPTTRYLIPVVTALGGLAGGLLIYFLAPEAAGVGTDAAIKAFHRGGANIRSRTPILKLLTSAITIGTGGTSGREGPIAQIGAGAGSAISNLFKLDKRSREIALAAGLGAGIASIFKAPLAGAIISAEIFYTRDFEVDALIPGFVASVVGYSIVGYAIGWQPIFTTNVSPIEFRNPLSLPFYAFLGILCALLTRMLIKIYYPTTATFQKWKVPLYVKTMIGGLATGVIGMFFLSVLGTGYGWTQIALDGNFSLFPPLLILGAIVAEMFSLSFTLGSGGSGGIFGPSIVIGGLIGTTVGYGLNLVFPAIVPNPSDFAIVGMMAFFAADGKAPISTIVLVAEMSGGYGLLAPSMFAVAPAFLLSGDRSVFPSQVPTRFESPAHSEEFEALELERTLVQDVMVKNPPSVKPEDNMDTVQQIMTENTLDMIPVAGPQHKLVGVIRTDDLRKIPEEKRRETSARAAMRIQYYSCRANDDLYGALRPMMVNNIGSLPVVSDNESKTLVGIITRRDIGRFIQTEDLKIKSLTAQTGQDSRT